VPTIPVINIETLRAGERQAVNEIAQEMLAAAENLGFFYVSGHGVSQQILDNAEAEARAFFSQPLADKMTVEINHQHRGFLRIGEATMQGAKQPDLKESFVWGLEIDPSDPDIASDNPFLGENNWPAARPAMREALTTYFSALSDVGKDLLRAFAVSMNLPSEAFVTGFTRPISRGSAIFYPPQPAAQDDEQYGVSAHTDFGCITLLYQDPIGGLEVCSRDGQWLVAEPVAGTFVVNIGDLMARWTNDRFTSTPHRVRNRSSRERLSMAVFVDPDFETVVDSAVACGQGETPKYPPVRCGDYILGRYANSFAYRK
jgi:isopenicillin N synthase-like dioxygenase